MGLEAPHLSEEVYNVEDMLVVAQWMNVFLRRADVIKIACVAQSVNVISPLHTTRDGILKHTTYYPIMLFSQLASGAALDVAVTSPRYETAKFGDMPLLDASGSYDEATGKSALFIVNRSQMNSLPAELNWQSRAPQTISAVYQMSGTDPEGLQQPRQSEQTAPVRVTPPVVQNGCAENCCCHRFRSPSSKPNLSNLPTADRLTSRSAVHSPTLDLRPKGCDNLGLSRAGSLVNDE